MTPQEWTAVRRIARAEAQRAGGGGLPSVWTGEVQIYNEVLGGQGVRTLRGLAAVVSDLQTAVADASGAHGEVPCGDERAFGFEGGRVVSVQHGTGLGSDTAVLVRETALSYDPEGRIVSVLDVWEREGGLWAREVVLSYDDSGAVALVVRSGPGPFEVFGPSMPAAMAEGVE